MTGKRLMRTCCFAAVTCFLCRTSFAQAPTSSAELRLSKAIADWKVLAEDTNSSGGTGVWLSYSVAQKAKGSVDQSTVVVRGIRGAFRSSQIPWELQPLADAVERQYRGNVFLVANRVLTVPGRFTPPLYDGPAVIQINPKMIDKWVFVPSQSGGVRLMRQTYGQVLAHELSHAMDRGTPRYVDPERHEYNPWKEELHYLSQVNTKIGGNWLRTVLARTDSSSGFGKVARTDLWYRVSQEWHMSQLPDVSSLRLPDSYFVRPSVLPPPATLFSMQPPLWAYYRSPTYRPLPYRPYLPPNTQWPLPTSMSYTRR